MKMFQVVYECVFVASVIFVGCYLLFMYGRIYKIYKLSGEQLERVGFLWFAWHIQSPQFASSAEVLEALPQNVQAKITNFQSRTRRVHVGVALWIVFLILFGFLVNRIFA
jgi:hypothetical protein